MKPTQLCLYETCGEQVHAVYVYTTGEFVLRVFRCGIGIPVDMSVADIKTALNALNTDLSSFNNSK